MAFDVQISFDAADPAALAEFWAQTLGYEVEAPPSGYDSWPDFLQAQGVPQDQWNRASAIVDPSGNGPRYFFQLVLEGKTAKNRVHLDVRAAPNAQNLSERMEQLEAECTRLTRLGASRVERHEPSGLSNGHIVMRDPEGNEFCLD